MKCWPDFHRPRQTSLPSNEESGEIHELKTSISALISFPHDEVEDVIMLFSGATPDNRVGYWKRPDRCGIRTMGLPLSSVVAWRRI